MATPSYVYGATEAVCYENGSRIVVHVDEPWPADDPAVKARPDLFQDEPFDPASSVTPAVSGAEKRRRTAKKVAG